MFENDDRPEMVLGSMTQSPETVNKVLDELGYETQATEVVTDHPDKPPDPAAPPAETPAEGDEPAEETISTEPDAGEPAGEGTEPGDTPDAGADPAEPPAPRKRKGGLQRKIEKKDREITELQERIKALENRPSVPDPATETLPEIPPEPTMDDVDEEGNPKYANYEALTRAIVKRENLIAKRQDLEEAQAARQTKAETEAAETARLQKEAAEKRWNEQAEIGRSNHEDFDTVIERSSKMEAAVPLTEAMNDSDLHGELVYYLATHEDELSRLNALLEVPKNATPAEFRRKLRLAFAEVEKIEKLVSENMGTDAASGQEETPATEPARESRPSAAPPKKPAAAPAPKSPARAAAPAAAPPKAKPTPVVPTRARGATQRKSLSTMTREEIHEMQVNDPDSFRALVEGRN